MKSLVVIPVLLAGLMTFSCSSTGYNTQKGAAVGAGVGAIAGQIIGNNTAGTLIGAAVGALGGAVVGNAMDQEDMDRKMAAATAQRQQAVAVAPNESDAPPGRWVQVPGQWVGGKWVPAHRAWVPVNP
jgi:outer membrane lipoprotein SlyB